MARVLIVEDFPDVREMYADYLQFHGMDVISAETAMEGLALARARQPSIVVMDAGLPGMSGWLATELLKKDPETRHICVLMLTAHVFEDARQRAIAAGVDHFVGKPCLPDELHREILSVLATAPCDTHPNPENVRKAVSASARRIDQGRRKRA